MHEKAWYYIVEQREAKKMKLIYNHVRLVIAVLVLIIVMLSISLYESSYIEKIDTYYFNEYLREADMLEH